MAKTTERFSGSSSRTMRFVSSGRGPDVDILPAIDSVKRVVHADASERLDQLRALLSELYQVLGAVGAPEPMLNKIWAAANDDEIPSIDLLPVSEMDFDEVLSRQETIDGMANLLAKHLAARGGRRTSDAKRLAARKNGQKGGRPRTKVRAVQGR